MGLQFNHPWALLLLVPCVAFIWWAIRSTHRLTGIRKGFAIAIRMINLLLLVALASGLTPYSKIEHRDVVFVADRSASVNTDENLRGWISEAIGIKEEKDRAAVVSYGLNAAVERTLSDEEANGLALNAEVNRSFSNAARGMQLGSSLLDGAGRIVLLSDGNENVGDLLKQGRRLKEQGVAVDVVVIPQEQRVDAAVEKLDVPTSLKIGEKFTFEITVSSTIDGPAQLRLFEGEAEKAKENVTLEKGENRFVLQNVAAQPGFHRYRAEIYLAQDDRSENNAAYAFSRINGPPKVLIVESESDSSNNMIEALKASVIPYDVIQPEQLPMELADYARYDSMILNDVSATRISALPMQHLATAVSDYGIGLVMVGGNNSYGLGGYFKTPVERALPVYMDLQGKRQIPSLGLILVIDKSGSMDGGKLELAKEAAMRTVELLRDQDTVGVIAFDSSPWWVMEPVKLTERESVLSAIQGIQPDGGTEIYSAVSDALTRMLDVNTQRKHIILLTDGQSANNPGYGQLTAQMVDNDITMSTVAIGEGSDTALLEQLAKAAKGRYYYTNDQSTLPAIFSRETVMMSRTYIVENRFTPLLGQSSEWTRAFVEGLPPVDAYVATTAKETAETALLSPEGDPLLTRWQYGSGRSVAWTSDLLGEWSKDWTAWDKFPDVFVQWVKWTFPQFASEPYEIEAVLNGNEAELQIRASSNEDGSASSISTIITGPDGTKTEISPIPVVPGQYTGHMPVSGTGVYMGQIGGTTTAFVIPYSPEYRLTSDGGNEKLEKLAQLTGGRVLSIDSPGEAFRGERMVSRRLVDITRPLLIAALLLWLIDIALRRISIPWGRLAAALANLTRRAAHRGAPMADAAPALQRLEQRKRRAGQFYAGDGESKTVKPAAAARTVLTPKPQAAPSIEQPVTVAIPPAVPVGNHPAAQAGSSEENRSDETNAMSRLLAAKKRNRR